MLKSKLNDRYFDWMCHLVDGPGHPGRGSYSTLLRFLHGVDFTYTIPMDGNREADGIDLRYRFGYENSYENPLIAEYLDDRPCSVLEMMIALSIRCEENIMEDPDVGDRTGQWFWGMISNLGLAGMDDTGFDERYVGEVIWRFLNREYGKNGEGGLFTVRRPRRDLRSVEIWHQMCWYLDELC